ncbi:TetR/AcrR family transcriptional regulator [Micromonospora sp. 15K316]|uniref:TetR/AcrR family transcriptional regulator n=1 Tax=Micromonospora sp. 15K316 TaxID=2530376 RepID=UPI0010492815|nr:TetR/AcrR family transcriptional regulator [Micromonospora sp. 15K316]TDC39366.1 TetR/AcrR family transcriptional regulator [Micromonospora sp. 15K316]
MPVQVDEEIRERVLDVADRLYYSRGVQSVGMDALRAEAGISLKRLYQLFPSKESLVEEVLQRRRRLWNGLVETAVATGPTPRARLLAVYDMLARWFDEEDFRGCVFINTFGELGAVAPQLADLVREHKAQFQARLGELVAEAGGPASLASQLAILAEGAQTTAAIAGTSDAAVHARAAAATLVDSALAATTAS